MQQHNEDNWFEHYGVKGMRWGIRRDRQSKKSAYETASTLTDKELKKRVTRLNMEEQYVKLVEKKEKETRTSMEKGRDYVNEHLKEIGNDLLKRQSKRLANDLVKDMTNLAVPLAVETITKKRRG